MYSIVNGRPQKLHYGRSFSGPGPKERGCPCPKEPCGLVSTPDDACDQHPWMAFKTIRVTHWEQDCPGKDA